MIRFHVLVATGLLAIGAANADQGSRCETPLTETALEEMIAGGVPPARIRNLISLCGLDLGEPDAAATEARLKRIGVAPVALLALTPPDSAAPGTTWTSPIDRRSMVFVPSGSFRMGSEMTELGRDGDEEVHEVVVPSGFWIDTAEVTNDAYRQFVMGRPEWQKENVDAELRRAGYLKDWRGTSYPEGRGDSPVVWVNWHAARAYAAWAGKRLPTEAEWEYAVRAGSATRFWWGDAFSGERVLTDQRLAAVGLDRRTNRWGVRDGTGSVWEWTSTLYRPYPYRTDDGREDARVTGPRTTRGGSRANGDAFLRSANRSLEEADAVSDLLGFRCVR